MLENIYNRISKKTIDMILNIIIERYRSYEDWINSEQSQLLFLPEYAPHNRQHSISWAISSGFPSDTTINDELSVTRLEYSNKFTRPLLKNEKISVLILNKTTHFSAEYLNDFYALNRSTENEIKFIYFKFSVDKKKLTKVSLCIPDEHGTVIAEKVLLNKTQIELRIAS